MWPTPPHEVFIYEWVSKMCICCHKRYLSVTKFVNHATSTCCTSGAADVEVVMVKCVYGLFILSPMRRGAVWTLAAVSTHAALLVQKFCFEF